PGAPSPAGGGSSCMRDTAAGGSSRRRARKTAAAACKGWVARPRPLRVRRPRPGSATAITTAAILLPPQGRHRLLQQFGPQGAVSLLVHLAGGEVLIQFRQVGEDVVLFPLPRAALRPQGQDAARHHD